MRFDWRGLSTGRQVLLAAGLLLFIDLFLDWQQVCASFGPAGSVCGSRSGWHGIGILVGLGIAAGSGMLAAVLGGSLLAQGRSIDRVASPGRGLGPPGGDDAGRRVG